MLLNIIDELPVDLVGALVLSCLEICDIMKLEKACGSKASQQAFLNQIPFCHPVVLPFCKQIDTSTLKWFEKRRCKIQLLTIVFPGNNPVLQMKNLQVEEFELRLVSNVTIARYSGTDMASHIRYLNIGGDQDEAVISQLSRETGNVQKLRITNSEFFEKWLNADTLSRLRILKEIILHRSAVTVSIISLIVQTCLELTSITLCSYDIDDAIVMTIAKHCKKLETLELSLYPNITCQSLLALSKRGLPLTKLDIPYIPNIPNTDIARRCSHALSCIRHLDTDGFYENHHSLFIIVPYITELTGLGLESPTHNYLPLLTQYCHKLTQIEVRVDGYAVADILSLCRANPLLERLYCYSMCDITDPTLIELIHACPYLHTLSIPYETEITDIGILALSEHCTQLQWLDIDNCQKVTEAAVLQLLQRCRKLTRLVVSSSSLSEETWTQLDSNTQKRVNRW